VAGFFGLLDHRDEQGREGLTPTACFLVGALGRGLGCEKQYHRFLKDKPR